MDYEIRSRNKDLLDDLIQQVYESECPSETKDLFMKVAASLQTLNDSIETAHSRLDKRKDEFQNIMDEFKTLSQEVAKLTESQNESNKACMTLIKSMDKQVAELKRSYKRQNLYTLIVIAVTLISMFGAVKGATTASSIWNIVKVLIPS